MLYRKYYEMNPNDNVFWSRRLNGWLRNVKAVLYLGLPLRRLTSSAGPTVVFQAND